MPIFLALAVGFAIFVLIKKPGASIGMGGACPVPDEEAKAAAAPLLFALMSGGTPTAANIAMARSMVRRLEMCGQKAADADLIRSGIFAATKNPKDAPKGPVPDPGG